MHAARATYQVYIWRNCLESHPDIPSPVGFGWDQNDSGDFIIKWNTVNPAPDEVLDMMFCSCLRKCIAGSCPCVDNAMHCTDACTKQNCENFRDLDDDVDDETDYEYSSDDDDF